MNQKWRGNGAASSLYHHLLNSKGQRMLAVVGLWLINTLLQSSQLISPADRKLLCGLGWTPVVPGGATLVLVPHSHSLPFSQVAVISNCRSFETSLEVKPFVWAPAALGSHQETEILLWDFVPFVVCLSVGYARDSAAPRCWHTQERQLGTQCCSHSRACTQERAPEDTSPAPATTFPLQSCWVLCPQHRGWLQCHQSMQRQLSGWCSMWHCTGTFHCRETEKR